uniref:Uncharacterized mitochondrial protein AtMg00810-like n=1 Tax=Tanacetum cinerariifolium TaxID=118510 RepID=A0A6L2KJ69_TANCI|nr:uncharacterized mitochondrial protein AtMg00810-like [Tanacetum cinerariifolium]
MRSLDGVEVDISNIYTTYHVPTTPNTRIYKDRSLNNVIGDMQSGVQTRRMTVTTNEQGFISAIYEEKTHEDLHTCLFACFLSQEEPKRITNALKDPDKYVGEILRKFKCVDVKPASTPMDKQKALLKDLDGDDVDVHLYRFMIGSLMYLTSSTPDILFVVCICANFQVNPKVSHLHAIKRIFRYLNGQPKLGLWYPRDSPFNLVAYTNSDYARASLDKISTSRGCQFLRCRLISLQCKKQTVVVTSTTEAEYVADASCCGQVLWI